MDGPEIVNFALREASYKILEDGGFTFTFYSFRKIVILVNVFQVSKKIIKVLTLLSKASWLIRGDLQIKIAGVVIRKFLKKSLIAVRRNLSLWACL